MWSKKIIRISAVAMLLFTGVLVPAAAQTTTDQTATRDVDDDGFDDWGLLGLLGLAGLLGRRKERTVVDTRRV